MTISRRMVTSLALVASLVSCLPSEVDCYVSACETSATGSGGQGAGGGTTTPCGAFTTPRELVSSTSPPHAIAVDADSVYWVDAKGAYRVDKNTAAPVSNPKLFAPTFRQATTIPDCPGNVVAPGVLALTSESVLWTLWDHCSPYQPFGPILWVVPKNASGSPKAWGEGDALRDRGLGLALDGDRAIISAYFEHDAQAAIVTSDPSLVEDPSPPFVDTPYWATSIAVTSKWLYFADHDKVGLFRASRAKLGDEAESIDPSGAVTKLVVDPSDGSVFYLSGALVRRYDGNAEPTTIASEPAETPSDLTIDGACVYWGLASGHVRAAPKSGGKTTELATITTTSLAADDAGVYVADAANGTIWMLPKSP
jgi:hypothetical protein